MKKLNLYGCSFSKYLYSIENIFYSNFDFTNYGKESASNFYIFNKFKDTAEENSISIIQWSSLTRPFDDNFTILKTSENPLYDLLEQWYELLDSSKQIAKDKNIKLIQFIGWAQWKDSELNEYHREKLKSYDIIWYASSAQWDLIKSNCFQLHPSNWSADKNEKGLYYWDRLIWGGMSEWIRQNVPMEERYLILNEKKYGKRYDSHPSMYGSKQFYEKSIFPLIINKQII